MTLWTVACQAPLSMIFLRREYWGEFVGLMNKLGLQTDFQNGTCLYVEDLLCSELWFSFVSLGLSLSLTPFLPSILGVSISYSIGSFFLLKLATIGFCCLRPRISIVGELACVKKRVKCIHICISFFTDFIS